MKRLCTVEKKELLAKLAAFNYSGMEVKICESLCYHYKSSVGRDYKALPQIALYLFGPYICYQQRRQIWLVEANEIIAFLPQITTK